MTDPGDTGTGIKTDHERVDSTRRRVVLIGGVLPALAALGGAILSLSWLPELPDPVAIHWGPSGPDGFGAAWPAVVLPIVLTIVFAVAAVAASWRVAPDGSLIGSQKLLVVASLWLAVLLVVVFTGSLHIQRGLADARDAVGGDAVTLWALGISTLVAVAAWFVLPPSRRAPLEEAAEPLPLGETERAVWSRTITIAPAGWWVIGVGLALALAGVVAAVLADALWPVAAGCFVLFLVLAATIGAWRVTVDRNGLRVRAAVGWPNIVIPLSEIESVRTVHVVPFRDFGGWGYRWDTHDRVGVVVRAGEAIEVERKSAKRFVVTVPDAETAARLLSAHLR